jgi:hypothetical protein
MLVHTTKVFIRTNNYISDPQALHHILVKACPQQPSLLAVSNLRCRIKIHLNEVASTSREIPWSSVSRKPSHPDTFNTINFLFGKGVLSTLGLLPTDFLLLGVY